MPTRNKVKILFRLSQDDDGYPPIAAESVWAGVTPENRFVLDNIPFFTREATFEDVVSADEDNEGNLWFSEIRVRSENSLLRVVLFETDRLNELRQQLVDLGCATEWSGAQNLLAINVPGTVALASIQTHLHEKSLLGWLDYEEPILRQ
jgi:hypothetical protein